MEENERCLVCRRNIIILYVERNLSPLPESRLRDSATSRVVDPASLTKTNIKYAYCRCSELRKAIGLKEISARQNMLKIK